jgi:Spy/CpxP family protein refolding chaperone
MKTTISAIGLILALPIALSLSSAGPAAAQQQDTATARQPWGMRGMRAHGRMGAGMRAGPGLRAGVRGMMRAGHVGPRMFLGLKEELGLSDEQVSRLEKIQEDHHALMQAQMENLRDLRDSLGQARMDRDWDAVNSKLDEQSNLITGIQKGIVNVERQSWEVLNDEQREKFGTWQEGARLFRRQGMRGWREWRRGAGMGMQQRLRIHADTTQSR